MFGGKIDGHEENRGLIRGVLNRASDSLELVADCRDRNSLSDARPSGVEAIVASPSPENRRLLFLTTYSVKPGTANCPRPA